MEIGKKIYYDIGTGEVIIEVSERSGHVVETTIEKDILTFKALSERNRATFDYIQLEYGQHSQDFVECDGYRINPATKTITFSYPDPNSEEPQAPIYQKPLSVEVAELRYQLTLAQNAIDDIILGGM